jgi:two-component sensor histidine kinase
VKALVVDGDPRELHLLEALVESYGYEAETASDGVGALAKLSQGGVDIVISDILMRGMDGYQLCFRVKSDHRYWAIPFVFYTANHSDSEDEDLAIELGAEGFIKKPEDPVIFMQKIRDVLEGHSTGQRTPPKFPKIEEVVYLRKYNERLIKKIMDKVLRLEQLDASLREKDLLLKEVHHRAKNNLQLIASLLNLQLDYVEDPRILAMLRGCHARIKSMALIHEKLYQSPDLTRVDMGEYIRNLMSMLLDSYGNPTNRIAVDVNVRGVRLGVNVAIPCGLIIQELVSNSLKHAFPGDRKGKIWVDLSSDKEPGFILRVRDNGIGLPKDLYPQRVESLGLQLVHRLAEQLEGNIGFERGQGTEISILIKAAGCGEG